MAGKIPSRDSASWSAFLAALADISVQEMPSEIAAIRQRHRGLPPFVLSIGAYSAGWFGFLRDAFKGRAFGAGGRVTPVAAQNSFGQLFNPIGSGLLLVVRSMLGELDTAGDLIFGIGSIELVNANANIQSLDFAAGGPVPVTHFNLGASAAAFPGTPYHRTGVLASTRVTCPPEGDFVAICPPGSGVIVWANTQNIALCPNFIAAELDLTEQS